MSATKNQKPENWIVQQAAKHVLLEVASFISPDSTEQTIAAFASRRLAELGFPSTWYYGCQSFVLLGSRSCLSISGREYVPTAEAVGNENLVTVDLSPCSSSAWGDCARSYAVEHGVVVEEPSRSEFRTGMKFIRHLHAEVVRFATPDTRFCDLFEFANDMISQEGFENLDFAGNVGHSIATKLSDRIYLAAGNRHQLKSVSCFTFEPHIRQINGRWGFKHENIYYFDDDGRLTEL